MAARVVVAEDDVKQAELVRRYLVRDGHDVQVVHDGAAALRAAHGADLVVLDVMMPPPDGLAVTRRLRAEPGGEALAILVLTARVAEEDLLEALELGADDYLTKPYSPRELAARVRTLLRRTTRGGPAGSAGSAGSAGQPALRVGDVEVDPVRHEARVAGELVGLTPGEFAVLELLAREPGRVFSREQVISHVHGVDGYLTPRTVDVHVMNLRRKIEAEPRHPRRLLTVYGVGYKLVPDRG